MAKPYTGVPPLRPGYITYRASVADILAHSLSLDRVRRVRLQMAVPQLVVRSRYFLEHFKHHIYAASRGFALTVREDPDFSH